MNLVKLGALSAALALCFFSSGCGERTAPAEPIPLGRLSRVATPTHYRLEFTIAPEAERFSGRAEIDVTFSGRRSGIYMHGLGLKVSEASVMLPDGTRIPATYRQVHDSGVAWLDFAREVPAGPAKLVFVYDAPFGSSLAGLYKVVDKGDAYAFTQFESIDARRAFPSFDEPGFKTPFDIAVIAPAADMVIGNTPVAAAAPAGAGMTRTAFVTTKPLPTYLIALAVGPLDVVDGGDIPANKYRDHPIHLRGVTARGNGARIAYALSLTPKVVTALENYFGIAYPFQKLDILAVPDFAAGAMENAGAITFRERLLLMDANASLNQKRDALTVQAHELTHQWFGDLVTPAWWDDIWLNESFATWAEYKVSAAVMPNGEFGRATLQGSLRVMNLDELPSARQIRQPVNGPDDIENAFDDITYSKGAAVLAMFESFVGEEAWRAGIHAYLTKFASGNATAQDFIGTIARSTGHPEIVDAFNSYINQPGVPLMQVTPGCAGQPAHVHVAQSLYEFFGNGSPQRQWQVPMCLSADGGAKLCALVGQPAADIALGSRCPKSVMPNAGGKGYYRFAFDESGWRALVAAAPRLDPADQLTLFYNVYAALRAGHASAQDFFSMLAKLAPAARWDLLGEMEPNNPGGILDTLRELRVNILAPADLPAYRALVSRLFARRMAALGLRAKPGEAPARMLTRAALVRLMVEEARDPQLIAALARDAKAFLASGGKNTGGLPVELVPEAIRAGLMSQDAMFGDAVLALYEKTNDENLRRALVHAMTSSPDPAFLQKLLALALTSRMRAGELRYLSQFWPEEALPRDEMWSWLKANFAAIEKRLSAQGMGRAPNTLSTACDRAARADLDAFFAPKASTLQGVPRKLAQAEEKIDRCIAFKAAKGAEIVAALRAAAGR